MHFCASSLSFKDIVFDLEKVGQGHRIQKYIITPFDGKYQNLLQLLDEFSH